jgi:hypothetical protein
MDVNKLVRMANQIAAAAIAKLAEEKPRAA